jgi:hypothetical protein
VSTGTYACGQIVTASLDLGVGYQAGCQLMRALVHGLLAAEHAVESLGSARGLTSSETTITIFSAEAPYISLQSASILGLDMRRRMR